LEQKGVERDLARHWASAEQVAAHTPVLQKGEAVGQSASATQAKQDPAVQKGLDGVAAAHWALVEHLAWHMLFTQKLPTGLPEQWLSLEQATQFPATQAGALGPHWLSFEQRDEQKPVAVLQKAAVPVHWLLDWH